MIKQHPHKLCHEGDIFSKMSQFLSSLHLRPFPKSMDNGGDGDEKSEDSDDTTCDKKPCHDTESSKYQDNTRETNHIFCLKSPFMMFGMVCELL